MKTRIEEYSVGQLAQASGVSVRTLHHYDDIGLLKPAHIGANGYRLYGRAELLRLQEIMFYRDVGMPLAEISTLLSGPSDAVDRLIQHRDRLNAQTRRTRAIIATLNSTIAHLKGETDMALNALYHPFSAEKQAEYEQWLTDHYGPDMAKSISTSKSSIKALPTGMKGAMAELREIEARLVKLYEQDKAPESDAAHDVFEDHRALIAKLWGRDCPSGAYTGLAQTYAAHPDFVARFEQLSPRFSAWLPVVMKAHAARLGENRDSAKR